MALKFDILILAGGRSSRMNGRDKGFILFKELPFIEYIHSLAREVSQKYHGNIYISSNRNIHRYIKYAPVITDITPDYQGPLAGIYAGLQYLNTLYSNNTYLLVLPVDTPHLNIDVIHSLVKATNNNDISVIHDEHYMHPTIMILNKNLMQNIKAYITNGNTKLSDWIKTQNYLEVFVKNSKVLDNINTPEQLQ